MNSTLLRDHRLLPYALIAPAIVLLSVFYLYPIGYNAVLSLFSWDLRGPMTFIGFDNFAELASDPDFGLVLRNTVVYTVTEVILVMLIGLGLALYLNSLRRFGGFLQAVTFAPNVVALVSVSLIFVWLMDTDNGLFNQLLASAGLPEVGWLSDPDVALFSLVLAATIVVSMQVLGVLLIAGATVIPPVSARMLSDRFRTVLLLSTGLGAACGFVGIYLSFFIDVSSGAAVVLVEAGVFALVMAYSNFRPRRVPNELENVHRADVGRLSPGEPD